MPVEQNKKKNLSSRNVVSRAHVQSGRLDFGGESHAGDGVKWWPFLVVLTVVMVLVPRSYT